MRYQRGAALLLVLWCVALLSAMALIELRLVRVSTDDAVAMQTGIVNESRNVAGANLAILQALVSEGISASGTAIKNLPKFTIESESRRLDVNRSARSSLGLVADSYGLKDEGVRVVLSSARDHGAFLSIDDFLFLIQANSRFEAFGESNLTVFSGRTDVDTREASEELLDALKLDRGRGEESFLSSQGQNELRESVYRIGRYNSEMGAWSTVVRISMAGQKRVSVLNVE